MRRFLGLFGLAAALLLGASGAALLVSPSEAAPPVVDQVAPPPLVPPDDPPMRGALAEGGPAPASLADGTRIRMPRLRIDLPLERGDSGRDIDAQATPADAAYLLPGSAVPGTVGNAYVYGHARPGLFLALWDVRLGDVIEVAEPSGAVLCYVVAEIHPRVEPRDLRYILPTDDERLTLQTSTGSWTLSPRFVIVALPARLLHDLGPASLTRCAAGRARRSG